jgi:hypothetical protein
VEERLITLYKTVLGLLQNIPTLERDIMENLIWTHTPMLASVHHMEDTVMAMQTRISKAIANAVGPLNAYLDTFKPYAELLEINVENYIDNFKQTKHTLEEMKELITFHVNQQREIEAR